jgi:hypothetical protein
MTEPAWSELVFSNIGERKKDSPACREER